MPDSKTVLELKTKADFDSILKEAGSRLVVVNFAATWCGPCKRINPKFSELAASSINVVFVMIDVDANKETSTACGIKCMPTFQFYVNGDKVDEFSGADDDELERKIKCNTPSNL